MKISPKYIIFFLLGLAFLLRIYKVNSPIIGMASWRQADAAAISRNYFENDYRFLYPQVDWGGSSAGFVETEFPLYSFAVALLYKIFGVSESYGRLLSIIFSLITLYFLYLLVLKLIDRKTALWSCFFFAILPPAVFFSRTFQPESLLLMSLVLGIYLFFQWTETNKLGYVIISSVFISLACLIKPPSLCIGLPLLYLAWQKFGKKVLTKGSFWLYGLLVLFPVGMWYFHAHNIFLKHGLTFGIWGYGTDKWGNWDLVFSLKFWNRILFMNIAEDYLTWPGFVIFIIGLLLKRKNHKEKFFDIWLIALFVYFVIVAGGNYYHLYYQLPFLFPATVYMGKVFARYFKPRALYEKRSLFLSIGLVGILILSAGRYHIYMSKENVKTSDTVRLARAVNKIIEKEALIIAVDRNDPTLLYHAHRKGWHSFPEQLDDIFLAPKIQKGAKYIIGHYRDFKNELEKEKLNDLRENFKMIYDDGTSFIFSTIAYIEKQ